MTGKSAVRLGDIGTGHDCHYPPTAAIEGSANVLINGQPAVRVGDAYDAHGCFVCPALVHGRKLAQGSPTVMINNRAAGRVGDAIDCGGVAIEDSVNVLLDSGDTHL